MLRFTLNMFTINFLISTTFLAPTLANEKKHTTQDCVLFQTYPEDLTLELRQAFLGKALYLPKSGILNENLSAENSVSHFKYQIENLKCHKITADTEIDLVYKENKHNPKLSYYVLRQNQKSLALIYNQKYAIKVLKDFSKYFSDSSQKTSKKCTLVQAQYGTDFPRYYVVEAKGEYGEFLSTGYETHEQALTSMNAYIDAGYCALAEGKYTSEENKDLSAFK